MNNEHDDNIIRLLWANNGTYEYNLDIVLYTIQLLPIEMLNLCEITPSVEKIMFLTADYRVNWQQLSYNMALPTEIFLKYSDKDWNWFILSMHRVVTPKFIEEHPNLRWVTNGICYNPNLTFDYLLQLKHKLDFCRSICTNKVITMDIIEKYPEWPWDYCALSCNPNITIDFILKNIDKDFNWDCISSNKAITIDFVKKYPKLPWNYNTLSQNPNITLEFILSTTNNKYELNKNNAIDLSEIAEYSFKEDTKNWNWYFISANKGITMDDVRANKHLPWNYNELSRNSNLTIDFVMENLHQQWNWKLIAMNKAMTKFDADVCPNLHKYFYLNPNITLEYILENICMAYFSFLWSSTNNENSFYNELFAYSNIFVY